MKDDEELLTTDEVAQRYKIPKQTQKIYREKRGLPFMRPGKRIYYKKATLDAWFKKFIINGDAEEHY